MSTAQMSLRDAQDWLRDRVDDGAKCPCCTQYAKVYRRKINGAQARSLITIWRRYGTDWCHVPTVIPTGSREESKLAHWNLMEELGEAREDGGRSGWWRITDVGAAYVLGEVSVPKYARIYDGRCLGFDGELQSIIDALGVKFNYRELMAGV